MTRKGIVLAGGTGTRLHPVTLAVSKQMLPIYDKPMIYYPISVLMLAGIREIAIITTPRDQAQFVALLGDGSQWGVSFTFIEQPTPDGIAQAFVLADAFLDGAPAALILGDNIFFGHGLTDLVRRADQTAQGATVFGYRVNDPERYGIVTFDDDWRVTSIEEKPAVPQSPYALTGLYFVDGTAPERVTAIKPSARGELEITDLLNSYLTDKTLRVERMGRGYMWLDTGTHTSLLDAGNFVRTLQTRQDQQVGCPEEIAFENGWITPDELAKIAGTYGKTSYGRYLQKLLD